MPLDPRTVPIARGLAPPIALQDAVRAASILLTGAHPSAPLAPPWRASYARWRADATRAAQALPRVTHAQRRLERAACDAEGRLDALAAAELQQAHGRLRTVHRTRPGRQLHVGSVVPGGWAGLAVDVRRMPSGRPRTAAAGMDGAEMRRAREAAGMGLRELGRALGVSDGTVRRYESGEREIPEAVVRAVRTLGLGAPETPLQNRVYQGVSGASSVQVSPSRGFGRSPLQGVSGAASVNCDAPTAPRRARRIDLGALTGTDDHGGTR